MLSISPAAELDYERDLRIFHGDDDVDGGEAFSRLWNRIVLSLKNGLILVGWKEDDADDHLQVVRIRLWERRHSFEAKSPGAWWAFVRKVSQNLAIDQARGQKEVRQASLEEAIDIPERDMPYVDAIVVAAQDLERVYEAADDLWLGKGGHLTEVAVLAAQLCLIEGFDRDTAAHLLEVSRSQIDAWLSDPSLVMRVAYEELNWSNDGLAGFVLRPQEPYPSSQLDELIRRAQEGGPGGIDGWSWDEALAVLLWIRNGLHSEQILRFEQCGMNGDQLAVVLLRARDLFPFERIATTLLERLDRSVPPEVLENSGLFRRLVFQYQVSSELPKRQVFERTEPAAEVFGYKLTEVMLNNWIAQGRLWSQLAAFVQSQGAP